MANDKKIKIRVRLVVIKNGKILLSYVKDEDFYFYIGGKMEFGETVRQACKREIKEECNAEFTFKKILYIRDYIRPEEDEHSLELFVLGDIDKFEELEGFPDPEFPENHYQTWVDVNKLSETNVKPKNLTDRIIDDYKNRFPEGAVYLESIE